MEPVQAPVPKWLVTGAGTGSKMASIYQIKYMGKELEDVIGVKSKIQPIAIRTRWGGEERRERERERREGG